MARPKRSPERFLQTPVFFLPVLVTIFVIPIVLAARGDLWLDEIWSLEFARSAQSVSDLFIRFRHDNNHPLNTLFLYGVREQGIFLVDRLLALVSGIGVMLLVAQEAKRAWGEHAAAWGVILIGTAFPLVLYFSEARGYAPAMFFSLLAYVCLVRNLSNFAFFRLVIFWVASLLGVLSHSTFVIASIAYLILHLASCFQGGSPYRRKLTVFLMHQVPALAFPAVWYLIFVRHMEVGGGPVQPVHAVIAETAAYLLGLPIHSPWSYLALIVVVMTLVIGTRRLRQNGRTEWIFFPVMLVLAPALVLLIARPKYLYFRYFILCFPFFYMLLACVISRATRPRPLFWLLTLAVLLSIAGHGTRLVPLLAKGRGHYAEAWSRIAALTPGPDVYVGSDHDFRNRMVLRFYAARDTGGRLLYYVPQSEWTEQPPDWVLVTQGQEFAKPPPRIPFRDVGSYRYVGSYDAGPVSGWGWYLYRREGS